MIFNVSIEEIKEPSYYFFVRRRSCEAKPIMHATVLTAAGAAPSAMQQPLLGTGVSSGTVQQPLLGAGVSSGTVQQAPAGSRCCT